MSRPRLVLMVPLRRCGSNAIRLRLQLNPHICCPYPLHIGDLKKKISEEDLGDDAHYFQLIVDVIGLQALSLIRWPDMVFDPVEIFEALRHEEVSRRSVWQIYGELLRRTAERQGVSVVMDKSQDSVTDFEELIRLFPEIMFLDIVRDPRAQVASMNRSILYDFDSTLNAIRWAESREWVDKIDAAYPSRLRTFRYEDLVTEPEHTLRAICEFLSIPFHEDMLDISLSNEAAHMSALSPLWETNSSPPDPSRIHRYQHQDQLSQEEIMVIENITLPWMDRYGYECHFLTHSFPETHNLLECARKSRQREEQAWKCLQKDYPLDAILRQTRARYLNSLH